MNIIVLSAWNTDSGVCFHTEPLVKSWIKAGHEVRVITHVETDTHGKIIKYPDEDYVSRAFGTRKSNILIPSGFPYNDMKHVDAIVLCDLRMITSNVILKFIMWARLVYPNIKIGQVVHEAMYPTDLSNAFTRFAWDFNIYFDKRQKEFLDKLYLEPTLHYFPFPVAQWRGDVPTHWDERKPLVIEYTDRGYVGCPKIEEIHDIANVLTVGEDDSDSDGFIQVLGFDEMCKQADALILYKFTKDKRAVVSTTALQAIGTGVPVIAPEESDFFDDMKECIYGLATSGANLKQLVNVVLREHPHPKWFEVKEFVESRSPDIIASDMLKVLK
jgi:hypothetical protein